MKLEQGQAAVLIVYRSESEPTKYWFAVRKAKSSFSRSTHDFHLDGLQEVVLELGDQLEFPDAMEKAIAAIKEIQP